MRNRKRRKARKGKPPGGRPSKPTPTVQAKLCRALAMGAHYEPACVYAGVSYSTVRKWLIAGQREVNGQFREFFEVVTRAMHKAALKHWQGHMAKDYRACRDFERYLEDFIVRKKRVSIGMQLEDKLKSILRKRGKPGLITSLSESERQYIEKLVVDNGGRWCFRIKKCYRNAQRLILADSDRRLRYWEGYIEGEILHAWVTINGKVVDLTVEAHNDPSGWNYIGIVIDCPTVLRHLLEYEEHSSVLRRKIAIRLGGSPTIGW